MSVTILKTLGTWAPRAPDDVERSTVLRGRVITGLLTGEDPDPRPAAPEPPPR